ncbi:hypothetical protein U1Q18_025450 [Sarracenia purpurea var. burkii]
METSSPGSGFVEAPMPKADPTSFGMKVAGSLPPIDVKTIAGRDHAGNVSAVSIATEPLASKTEGEGC